jgi:hypothetical protein
LTLWDLVFGTFFHPKERGAPAAMGLLPPRHTTGYVDDLVYPFKELAKERRGASTAEPTPEKA